MTKNTLISGTAIAVALFSGAAAAGVTGNVGMVSDYYFRGVQQTASASANGGVDYEHESGFYVGVWAADVEGQAGTPPPGIEIDTYAGYKGEFESLGYLVGFTHYGYTGSFDTSYDEVNLGASYGDFSLDIASGTHESATPGTADDDYTFALLSYSKGPFAVSYGAFGGDWGGSYVELGLSTDIAGADVGVSVINGNPDDSFTGTGTNTTDGTAIVFSISKGFDL